MPAQNDALGSPMAGSRIFHTTHWSVVLAARDKQDQQASDALETLCRTYWYPLYAFVRRQGHAPHDAQDLTQGFFARLLEKNYLAAVEQRKGRFRSFLLAAIKHFLADQRDRAAAQKRGGGQPLISLEAETAEEKYRLDPAHELTPDKLFERRWALSLLSAVFQRLEKEHAAAGKRERFQVVQRFLSPDSGEPDYSAAARQLDMNEGAVRMAVSRLRRRYAELFRDEVANTVADPREIEDEMHHLRRILSL